MNSVLAEIQEFFAFIASIIKSFADFFTGLFTKAEDTSAAE